MIDSIYYNNYYHTMRCDVNINYASPSRGETWRGTRVSCLSLRGQTLEVHWPLALTLHCTGLLSTPWQLESCLGMCTMSARETNAHETAHVHQEYITNTITEGITGLVKTQALLIENILPDTAVTGIQWQRWMQIDTESTYPGHPWRDVWSPNNDFHVHKPLPA